MKLSPVELWIGDIEIAGVTCDEMHKHISGKSFEHRGCYLPIFFLWIDIGTTESRRGNLRSTNSLLCTGTYLWQDWLSLYALRYVWINMLQLLIIRTMKIFRILCCFSSIKVWIIMIGHYVNVSLNFFSACCILRNLPSRLLDTRRSKSRQATHAQRDVSGERGEVPCSLLNTRRWPEESERIWGKISIATLSNEDTSLTSHRSIMVKSLFSELAHYMVKPDQP